VNATGRRQLLRVALAGAAAVTVTGLTGTAPAAAVGRDDPGLPEVPGMLGDRRANEFWYQFDEATFYRVSPELKEAYDAIARYLGDDYEASFYQTWRTMRGSAEYPDNFTSYVAPIRAPLAVLSRTQLDVVDRYYPRNPHGLADAFGYFGQGVLYDPRRASKIHTMGGDPPGGYHTWYVFMRAMMLLDVDRRHWRGIAPLDAFGWAVQTVAKPNQKEVNPPLPESTVRELKRSWLPRPVHRLDRDFLSFPYPEGAGAAGPGTS
jgi:hypothetical protein